MKAKISKTAFADFNEKKKEKRKEMLEAIKQDQQALIADLKAAVPKNLAIWLNKAGASVIKDLLEYGRTNRKYDHSDQDKETYGYTSLNVFEKRLKTLRKVWNNTVKISTSWDANYRLEIFFEVAV